MTDSQHPLSPLKFDVANYDDTDIRALKWESARVEATVKRLKLGRNVLPELRKNGNGELTFEGFNERFPDELVRLPSPDGRRPLGMIFPRKGFREGLIVHSGDWEAFSADNSSCHLFKGKGGFTLLVQPYAAFLDHVRDGILWVPTSP